MLRTHPPVERYAGAAAVVAGQQNVGADHDVQLTERARVAPRSPLAWRPARRPGRDRRRVGACPARRPRRRCPWVGKRRADPLRAERRTPARPTRRGRHRLSRRARRAAAASHRPSRTRTVTVVGVARPRHPVTQQTRDLPHRRRGDRLAGHPGRVDAIGLLAGPGFDINRVRAAASGAQVLTGAARGQGRIPRAPADAHHSYPRHSGLRRTRAVHRHVRRGQHAKSLNPAARARNRAAEGGGRDARADPPHDRLGSGDHRPDRLGRRDLARDRARPHARTRARAPRHRPAELRPQLRLAPRRRRDRLRGRHLAARGPGRRTARRPSAANPRAHRRRGRAAAARARGGSSAGCSRSPAPCRCSPCRPPPARPRPPRRQRK